MARIHFTPHLRRHLNCDTLEVEGETVAAALRAAEAKIPGLLAYVLDDLGRVRQHVMIFVDDQPLGDRRALSDPLAPASSVYVMQALSGG